MDKARKILLLILVCLLLVRGVTWLFGGMLLAGIAMLCATILIGGVMFCAEQKVGRWQ